MVLVQVRWGRAEASHPVASNGARQQGWGTRDRAGEWAIGKSWAGGGKMQPQVPRSARDDRLRLWVMRGDGACWGVLVPLMESWGFPPCSLERREATRMGHPWLVPDRLA